MNAPFGRIFRPHTEQPADPVGAIIAVKDPGFPHAPADEPRHFLLPELYHWQHGQFVTVDGGRPLDVVRYPVFWWAREDDMLTELEHPEALTPHSAADVFRAFQALDEIATIRVNAGSGKLHRVVQIAREARGG